jgi:leucyl aminopeptidase
VFQIPHARYEKLDDNGQQVLDYILGYCRYIADVLLREASSKLKLLFVCDTNAAASATEVSKKDPLVDDGKSVSPLERAMLAASAARYGASPMAASPSVESATMQPFQRDISAILHKCKQNLQRKLRVNAGTNTARALASLPPNVLNPATYTALIRDMAGHHGWELSEWTMEELESIGCGAFTAVTQGNGPNSSDRMIRLTRRAKDTTTGIGN